MGLSDITGSILGGVGRGIDRGIDEIGSSVGQLQGALFEPTIRLGVTGLSRAGKTVFITSLVANLLDRGRMQALSGRGKIQAAFLQPQPDDTVARFDYEHHLAALTGPEPFWPEGTKTTSELRLSFRIAPSGMLAGVRGPKVLHLDIFDYPGEWLLDLGLLERSYRDWADTALSRLDRRPGGAAYRGALSGIDPAAPFTDTAAKALASSYATHLKTAREAGFSDCSPGRSLLPGDLEGSPVLTFAPLPAGEGKPPKGSLGAEMERRFEAYKAQVVKPFFREHFARIDRQVVLADVLGAIHAGPAALEDLRGAMADVLRAFRPGRTSWLGGLLGRHRVEKILFAATKADHLHHTEHGRLTAITEALLREARDRADFAGAETQAMALAALRTTTEATIPHDGADLPAVRGRLPDGRSVALYPGTLPADPGQLLSPARQGADQWLEGDYGLMSFAPAPATLRPGDGPPHIRLDRAAQFLIGDRI